MEIAKINHRSYLELPKPPNRSFISQIPRCIRQISQTAPFWNRNVHTCAHFCYKMVHCGIWNCCIVEFVKWIYCKDRTQILLRTQKRHCLAITNLQHWWFFKLTKKSLTLPSWASYVKSIVSIFMRLTMLYWGHILHGPLTRYVNLGVVHAPGMPGTFPRHQFQRKALASNPVCHTCHDACRDR